MTHLFKSVRVAILLLLILCIPGLGQRAKAWQGATAVVSADRDRGIQLYKQGDNKGALEALRRAVKDHKDDLSAWHYLGLALEQKGDSGGAKKAHEKAARLGEDQLDRELNSPTSSSKQIGRALMSIRPQLIEAAESAEKYVALNPNQSKSKRQEWDFRAASLRAFADLAIGGDLEVYAGKDVTTRAKVMSKPEPGYTEEARRHKVSGSVTLRCIFGANGRVFGIRAVTSLPNGLTEQAMNAARKIKFIPATKDGRPVSMFIQLEYNFHIY